MGEPTRTEVTNCAACLFMRFRPQRDDMLCTNGVYRQIEGYPDDPPDWCPLRRADHLVTLRAKAL